MSDEERIQELLAYPFVDFTDKLREIIKSVRADEREQCAKEAEAFRDEFIANSPHGFVNHATYDATAIAYRIRERGR